MSSSDDALVEALEGLLQSAASRWLNFVLRGLFTFAFGLVFLVYPGTTLNTITRIFGAFFILDAIFSLVAVTLLCRSGAGSRLWSPYFFSFLVGIIIGIGTLVYPNITTDSFFIMMGVWFLLIGLSELSVYCILRKGLSGMCGFLMMFGGLVYVVFAILCFINPEEVASTLTRIAGVIIMLFGMEVIYFGMELRSFKNSDGVANLSSNQATSMV